MVQKINGNSRYSDSKILTYNEKKGVKIQYLSRRFIPADSTQTALKVQEVQTGDRPDLLAYRAYGDSLAYYRIADYNLAMNPFTLTTLPGRLLVVPG
ncbi:MAG: hypothetical protein JKY60_08260 [Kordiimonadaceae bacterium]|nr:hypothetical protein [Kordiimonadaceae bacterium]